jgi:hypothetical protein
MQVLLDVSACPEHLQATMILYVPPHSLLDHLDDMIAVLGATRRCCVARELTKVYETFERGSLEEVRATFVATAPRGEMTLVLDGSSEEELQAAGRGKVRFRVCTLSGGVCIQMGHVNMATLACLMACCIFSHRHAFEHYSYAVQERSFSCFQHTHG